MKYQGFRTAAGWEVVVRRPGEPPRLLDLPQRQGEWALRILTDYFGDESRAAALSPEFAALTIDRYHRGLGADCNRHRERPDGSRDPARPIPHGPDARLTVFGRVGLRPAHRRYETATTISASISSNNGLSG